jgi:hypothetical protein
MPSARRFPPPWSVRRDRRLLHPPGHKRAGARLRLFEDEPGTAHLLTRDEATPARERIGSQEARPPLTNHLRA